MASLASTFIAYVKCVRKSSGESFTIAAAFTDGDNDNLMPGRNGVFYDRKGNDFDATILSIIDNPISLRQAFWSPYKKFVRLLEEQVAKRATVANEDATKTVTTTAPGSTATPPPPPATPPPSRKIDVGTVAAIGVAFGAIGGFVTALWANVQTVIQLGPFAIIGSLLGLILLISGPSIILASIKLRKRYLGPILDASGWAINAKTRINVPFGTSLTTLAVLPPGSTRELQDRFAEKHFPWKTGLILLLILTVFWRWFVGDIDPYLPSPLKSTTRLGSYAPAAPPVPNVPSLEKK